MSISSCTCSSRQGTGSPRVPLLQEEAELRLGQCQESAQEDGMCLNWGRVSVAGQSPE